MKKYSTFAIFCIFLLFSIVIKAQVVADFSISPPDGCSPLAVTFTDLSTGNPTSWNWTFGNGNSSTDQNPGAIYINPNTYTVCLTVSDGATNDTHCDTVFVYDDPVIDFIADDTSGCANLLVNFTNLTTTGTGIASVIWNFGDGNTSTDINPTNTFTPGVFDITLIVTDSSGCVSQGDKLNYIESIFPPITNFSATNNQNCAIPTVVNFTNTSTFDGGATYTWDFGDGTPTSNIENPSHSYTNFGSYDVTLIIDKNGCLDTLTQINFVVLNPQNADFSVNSTNICEGESVSFTDLSTLVANSWSWDFGDGSAIGTGQNPNHVYNTAGTFTVSMTAHIPGCDDTEVKNALITVNPSPSASFVVDKTDTCTTPFSVNFTSTASAGVTYNWNFGDGNTSVLANPNHVYNTSGSFNVTLTVTSANGCTHDTTANSLINITPPVANFDIDTGFGCAPKTIQITDLSTSTNTITDWIWDFGDGSPTQNGPNNPTHIYTDTGDYEITLIIIDDGGCTDTLNPGIDLSVGQSFVPFFSVTPNVFCRKETFTITNLTDTLLINNVQWHWDFGDGGIGFGFEPSYEYEDTGYFDITLIAIQNGCASDTTLDSIVRVLPPIARMNTLFDCINLFDVEFQDNSLGPETWLWSINGDSIYNDTTTYTFPDTGTYHITLYVENITHGCIDSISQNVTIVDPTVNFSFDDSIGCPPFTVNFSDSSTDALAWSWNFGDGGTSTTQNPSHEYTTGGIFDVSLTITSLNGCTHTVIKPQIINALSNIPNFAADDTAGCRPLLVSFSDSSISTGGAITSWLWDFGDGNTSNLQNPVHTYQSIGIFDVSLQITDAAGCGGTLIKPQYINTSGPTPSFTNNTTCIGDTVFFNNTSTSVGGNITNWTWDFGDGNTSTDQNPIHFYNHAGTFDISLTILDDNGCDSTLFVPNSVTIDSFVVDFVADSTIGNCTGFIVNFQQQVSPNPITWEWDFGNGNSSSVANPSTVFNSVGDFDITLVATNINGCRDTLVKPNFITINGPFGILSSMPDSGCIDLDATFNIVTTNSIDQDWDFGDGATLFGSALTNTTHTYTTVGTYYPQVILEDNTGCQVAYPFDSIVVGSLVADATIDKNYICTPDMVNFTDLSVSTPPISSWNWNFGDGQTANSQNPSHNYTSDGIFDISLTISNGLCEDTISFPQYLVSDSSTNSLFTIIPPAIACPPVFVQFSNFSSADSTITNWNWDFGNGITSTIQDPASISFDTSGTFLITLDIVTEKGCISHFEDSLTINQIPTFSFNLDTIELCINTDTTLISLADADFTWTPSANLSCSDCSNPTITAISSETYFVHAVSVFGCTYDDTLEFIVHGTPALTVSEGEKVLIGTEVDLHAFSSGISDFIWSPSDNLSCNNCPDNTFIANETTQFAVTIKDNFGCVNKDSILIEVYDLCDDNSVFFPNVFTPNGDGKNDVFVATTKENLKSEINYYRIFDRWGNLVFETQDISEAWDGNDKNGNFLNNGVYVYVLDLICPDGSNTLIQGNITLIR